MKNKVKILILAAMAMVVMGCASSKSLSYLLDMNCDVPYGAPQPPEIRISQEDQLAIRVLSENEQLAAPFNAALGLPDATSTSSKAVTYLVDRDGCIEFPVLGILHVEGKTLRETEEMIAEKIREHGYIREPVVSVSLDNFCITVIGSVHNSVLTVNSPSINLFQVVARSGGTTKNVNINDVRVIRVENNVQKAYSVNLQSRDVFNSPVFYLKQNDMVYFKPKGSTLSSEGQVTMSFVSTGLTVASLVSNIIIWTVIRK